MPLRPPPHRLLLIGLLAIIAVAFAIRLSLIRIPLERDEGEYAYMGQLILDGLAPYQDAYAFKFPGIYFAYALIIGLFGSSDEAIRLGLCMVLGSTLIVLYFLVRKMLPDFRTSGFFAIAAYSVLSLGSSFLGLSANAEHFVVLPAIVGFTLLIIRHTPLRILLAGICLGAAVSIKQQGAAFVLGGLVLFFYENMGRGDSPNRPRATGTEVAGKKEVGVLAPTFFKNISPIALHFLILTLGILLPIIAFLLWVRSVGAWDSFTFWCFSYARFYGSMWTWGDALRHFLSKFGPIVIETFPILILASIGLVLAWKNHRRYFWLSTILLLSGFLATTPGLIFRPHYFIFILPGCACAAAFAFQKWRLPWEWIAVLTLCYPLLLQHDLFFFKNSEDASRALYPRNAFPEARMMAERVEKRSQKDERVAVLGSEPQIYFYANRRAAIPHIYMYPLLEPQPYAEGLQQHLIDMLEKNPPRLVVHVRVPNSWIVYSNSELKLIRWIPDFLKGYERIESIKAAAIPNVVGEREIILYERKK